MSVKDLLNKVENKAEEAARTDENAAAEVKDEAQEFMQGHMPPEPPKDENGNPIKPPEGMRPPFGMPPMGGNFPEPPKDENGNPIKPPEGMRPPMGMGMKPPFGEAAETVNEAADTVKDAAAKAGDAATEAVHAFANGRPPMGRPPMGGNFPEPPRDENGNPIKPPEGMRPPFDFKKPEENGSGTES